MDCNPGQVSNTKYTALMLACKNNISEIALKLLDMDCNPGQMNNEKYTALMIACINNMPEVVTKLLKLFRNECNVTYKSEKGKTAFDYACDNEMYSCIPLFPIKYKKCGDNMVVVLQQDT